jgi:hypothetical protein
MRGPNDAYESGRKRHYRREIWNLLESTSVMRAVPRSERRVLILDEWKAEETRHLISRGYTPNNITVVNLRVGTAARVTLSLKSCGISGVESKSGDVGQIFERLADAGVRFHAIHLDFCGNISAPLMETLECFNGASALGTTAIAVNMLCGRESAGNADYRSALDSYTRMGRTPDDARLGLACASLTIVAWEHNKLLCRQHLVNPCSGTYVSSNGQRMLWMAGELKNHGEALRDDDHRAAVRQISRQRTGVKAPPFTWAMPGCFKAMAIGRELSVEDIDAIADRSLALEGAAVSHEALITVGSRQAALLDAVLNRKLADEKLGPILRKQIAKQNADPRRSFSNWRSRHPEAIAVTEFE